jgi:imidazolonepropionase-like amidohydrolase
MRTLLVLAGLATAAAAQEDVILRGATVHTVSVGTLAEADVLVRGGKIAKVGPGIEETGARVVDLKGMHLYPGLICPMSSLGLVEIGAVRATQDAEEVGGWSPDVFAGIAVNPDSELIPVARANGYTHALSVPMGGTVSGHSSLMRLSGWTWEEMTEVRGAALHVFWPSMDLNLLPQSEHRGSGEWKSPEKQMEERRARIREIDEFFSAAETYAKGAGAEPVPAWEAMKPALQGRVPVFLHAGDERQIRAAVAWAQSRKLTRIVIAGGREAWRCADLLAQHKVPVIFDGTFANPTRDTDPYDAQFAAASVLQKAGVRVSFSNGAGNWGAADVRNIPYHAAQSAAFGLPREEAIKGLTLYPAELLGVSDRLGSIESGKQASLIAVDGDILDLRANVTRMWIAGVETTLESRHTRLYGKYRNRPK